MAAVQQADGALAEQLDEMGVPFLGGGQLRLVGAFDQGTHPIDLGTFGELGAQAGDQALDVVDRGLPGDDRLAAGGLLGEARHIEVAVVGHQQRARDRRSGHHQHVGAAAAALGLQGETLVYAEAVLLVDDGEGEVAEGHVLLEQGVRADQDVDLAGGQALEQFGARAALLAAGKQAEAQAGGFGQRRHGVGMLARQHLGRGHQGRLRAALDSHSHGHQRHHRLAGADVALQQPQHAMRGGHVLGDLGQRQALRVGEREGQGIGNAGTDAAIAGDGAAALALVALPHKGQRKLAGQQLVVGEPHPGCGGRRDVGGILRAVQAAERGAEIG